jgi:integrase
MKAGTAHGIPLNAGALEALKAARTLTGDKHPEGAVFRYDHKPIDNFNTKAFKKAAKAAGVGGLRWHDLRHTFAAWAVQAGVTLQELMQLGSWRSYQSVLVYAHLAPDHLRQAAEKIAKQSGTSPGGDSKLSRPGAKRGTKRA